MNYLRDFNDGQRASAPKWHISSYVIEEAPREPSRSSHVFSSFLQRFSTASDCSRTVYSPSPRPSFGEAFKRLSTAIKRSSKDANVAEHETENPAKKSWRFSWKPKHFKVKSSKGLTKRWKSIFSKWSRVPKTSENE